MKIGYAGIFLALIGVLGLGVVARANSLSQIKLTMPFEFVASGETLPAGNYTLRAVSDDARDGLFLISYDNHVGVIVRPIETEEAPAINSKASFERVGEQLFLNRIQTSDIVYNFSVPRTATLLAAKPLHQSAPNPASGNSGSN